MKKILTFVLLAAAPPACAAPVLSRADFNRLAARAGRFTPEFDKVYQALVEERRREAVRKELDQGRLRPYPKESYSYSVLD